MSCLSLRVSITMDAWYACGRNYYCVHCYLVDLLQHFNIYRWVLIFVDFFLGVHFSDCGKEELRYEWVVLLFSFHPKEWYLVCLLVLWCQGVSAFFNEFWCFVFLKKASIRRACGKELSYEEEEDYFHVRNVDVEFLQHCYMFSDIRLQQARVESCNVLDVYKRQM